MHMLVLVPASAVYTSVRSQLQIALCIICFSSHLTMPFHFCQHTQCAMLNPHKLHFWAPLWLQLPVSWVSIDNSVELQLQLQSCIALATGHRHTILTVITAWQLIDSLYGHDEENLLDYALQVKTESWAIWSGTAVMTMLLFSCSDILDPLLVCMARFEQIGTVAVDQLGGC